MGCRCDRSNCKRRRKNCENRSLAHLPQLCQHGSPLQRACLAVVQDACFCSSDTSVYRPLGWRDGSFWRFPQWPNECCRSWKLLARYARTSCDLMERCTSLTHPKKSKLPLLSIHPFLGMDLSTIIVDHNTIGMNPYLRSA